MKEPKITFPKEVAEEVEVYYQRANIILEYGSGGSTYLASKMENKKIFSIESDSAWLCNLGIQIRGSLPKSWPYLYYVDIGKTKEWGHPVDESRSKNWPNYSVGIWSENFFIQPDVVLIDGRFRKACFLATLAGCEKNMTVLFDDYSDRKHYHEVEKFISPTRFVGRMAIFEIKPGMVSTKDVLKYSSWMFVPA